MERVKGFEPSTSCLGSYLETNWLIVEANAAVHNNKS